MGGGGESCPYVIRTGVRAGQTCGKLHTQHRCFSRLDDACRAEFGDDVERPRWADLLRSGVAIFDLDYDAIISAMYALSFSAEGDYYRCVPPDPGIAAAALGVHASGTAPAKALHTFTLDSGASHCFFRDSTTLTPLSAPVPVRLADPSGGGEFSSDLLREFCRGEGILQSFTLSDSPQQNGIAEHHIGLVMEVALTSMIHEGAPHFLWSFAVLYATHQLNLWPRVSLPETSPTLRWTGEVGDASVFRVWGSRTFVRDKSADKLSARAIPCVFLGFVLDAPGCLFYHTTSRRVLPSQDVTFDESVPLLSAPPSDKSVEPSGPYPELVGCLMYLMTCTRPDLAYPLSLLARYVAPGRHRKVHWDAAKRVLHYLCSTSGMGLVLGGRGPVVLTGHADTSWVDDSATQRSSQGYTFSLGSGSVSWWSTCQTYML
ncbi:unnamed protein product [Closterium sp. NIES-53]